MFAKPHDVAASSASLLRNKEAKALRAKLAAGADTASVDAALPPRAPLEEAKLTASKLLLYSDVTVPSRPVPLFINLDPKGGITGGRLLPTLFALWRAPCLLPAVAVHAPVSRFVLNGADVMLPGIIASSLPRYAERALVSLIVDGNPAPFAVGEAVCSDAVARAGGMRGRGYRVLHRYRDELWTAGGRGVPNDGFLSDRVVRVGEGDDSDGGDEEVEEGSGDAVDAGDTAQPPATADAAPDSGIDAAAAGLEAVTIPASAADGGELSNTDSESDTATSAPPAEPSSPASATADGAPPAPPPQLTPDELLERTFLQALRRHVSPSDLPLLASQLLGVVMRDCRPAGSELEPRRTRWRKFGAFLAHMADRGVVTIATDESKGTQSVLSVNTEHELLRGYRPWPTSVEHAATATAAPSATSSGEGDDAASAAYTPPLIDELFTLNSSPAVARIFAFVAAAAVAGGGHPVGRLDPTNSRNAAAIAVGGGATFALPLTSSGDGGAEPPPLSVSEAALRLTHPTSALYSRGDVNAVLATYTALHSLPLPSDKRRVMLDEWLADAVVPSGGKRGGDAVADVDGALAAAPSSLRAAYPSLCAALHALALPPPPLPPPQRPLSPTDAAAASLPRPDLAAMWSEAATRRPVTLLHFPSSSDTVLLQGAAPKVVIRASRKAGGHVSTTIDGLQAYGVPLDAAARECARVFAGSASVRHSRPEASGGGAGTEPDRLLLQGDVVEEAAAHLAARYGLPQRLFDTGKGGGGSGGGGGKKGGGGGRK